MDFGALMFFTEYAVPANEFAQALEARGFESVWAPEHSHIPASRKSPWPGGGELPKVYYDAMDPIQTAKLVASLDQVSGGRFLFGVGGGWNAEEMADHGTEFRTRFKLMRERIEAMKEIWTKTKAEYHGDMVDFPEMMAWPKPVQKPHPPILVGGAFPHAARRAVRYGDGWAPIAGRGPDGDVEEVLPRFRQMLSEAGRDPHSVPVTLFGATEDADRLARYRDLGIVRVVVMLPSAKSDQILPTLDRWAELIHRAR